MGHKNYSITNDIGGRFDNYGLFEINLPIVSEQDIKGHVKYPELYLKRDHSKKSLSLCNKMMTIPYMNESFGDITFVKGGLSEKHRTVKFLIPVIDTDEIDSFMDGWKGQGYHILVYDYKEEAFKGIMLKWGAKGVYDVSFNPNFKYDAKCLGEYQLELDKNERALKRRR